MVALETSIVAQGLPHPQNLEAAYGCEEAIRAAGGVPATTAVIDGELRAGLTRVEIERLGTERTAVKVSSRDLGVVLASGREGSTTVAATVRIARLAGIRVMATGGIGGVHRGGRDDVSADLGEIAASPIAVFCAGAKMILDLPRTLERLDTLAVPVLGLACNEFPAFYTARSGLPVSARIDDHGGLAAALSRHWGCGLGGAVVAVPPPVELEGAWELVERAVAEVGEAIGAALTPALLERIAALSSGRSIAANVELVINNAREAALTAAALSSLPIMG